MSKRGLELGTFRLGERCLTARPQLHVLDINTTLCEKIKFTIREQGITILDVLTAFYTIVSTIVLAYENALEISSRVVVLLVP